MNKRTLILYTGGTIGMQASDQGYIPIVGFERLLTQHLRQRVLNQTSSSSSQLPDFDLLELDNLIDSANLTSADWVKITEKLIHSWEDYDGFIVLHGTDTMAYTASALSFMLRGINKPVIVTGSQIPLTELRNDALDNLITSLLLSANPMISEVCIYFNGRLLRGNRSVKVKSEGFDAFDSPNLPWLGEVGINIDIKKDILLKPGVPSFYAPEFNPEAVSMLQVYPGIPAGVVENLLACGSIKGLILQTYGVGNPPDQNHRLIEVLESASKNGIAIINISQCLYGSVNQGAYATGETLNRIGVIPGSDLTLEAAFTKLHMLISEGQDVGSIRANIATPICGECSA